MTVEEKITQAELREIWDTLQREQRKDLAGTVEGVLAELTDETLDATERLHGAMREWRAIARNPRGLPDWGIWREDDIQRVSVNRAFESHREAVNRLLG